MEVLGKLIGVVFFVVVVGWLAILIWSFFTAWISLARIIGGMNRQVPKAPADTHLTRAASLSRQYEARGLALLDPQAAAEKKRFAARTSIFVTLFLVGVACMAITNKLQHRNHPANTSSPTPQAPE